MPNSCGVAKFVLHDYPLAQTKGCYSFMPNCAVHAGHELFGMGIARKGIR